MNAPTYGSMWPEYARQWDRMTITRTSTVRAEAMKILENKKRYQAVEKLTGVPWWWIACAHMRESDLNWMASLAQGDRWDRRSVHVPAGRGPFKSWEAAAVDALVALKHMDRVQDWRLEKALYWWELYNGWGYHWHGVPSPYVWAASNIQRPGKYVADGVWSASATDNQLGCAAVLKMLMELDPTIRPKRETPMGYVDHVPDPASRPAEVPPVASPPMTPVQVPPAPKPNRWGGPVAVGAGAVAAGAVAWLAHYFSGG